ncbi:MAG: hypothetical protein WC455_17720 [Dehalococcoidia bacterium]|jgi:hypothetical protein
MSARNGKGYYPIPDVGTFPSVTTINDCLDKYNLRQWAANTDVDYLYDNTIRPFMGGEITLEQFREINFQRTVQDAKLAHTVKSGEAKDFGSRVHKALDEYHKIGGEVKIEGELIDALHKNIEWEELVKLEVIESEKTVYSRTHRYAGTLDLYCRATFDESRAPLRGIIDYKTYGGDDADKKFTAYKSHKYQIAAYVAALEEMEGMEDERLDFGIVMGIHRLTGEPSPKLFFRAELIRPFEEFAALAHYFNMSHRVK